MTWFIQQTNGKSKQKVGRTSKLNETQEISTKCNVWFLLSSRFEPIYCKNKKLWDNQENINIYWIYKYIIKELLLFYDDKVVPMF